MALAREEILLLVGQYLREEGLECTARALEEETQMKFVRGVEMKEVEGAIMAGNWGSAFHILQDIQISTPLREQMLEQAIKEMIYKDDLDNAEATINAAPISPKLRTSLTRAVAAARAGPNAPDTEVLRADVEATRRSIVRLLCAEVQAPEPRLLVRHLLQSVRFAQLAGGLGSPPTARLITDAARDTLAAAEAGAARSAEGAVGLLVRAEGAPRPLLFNEQLGTCRSRHLIGAATAVAWFRTSLHVCVGGDGGRVAIFEGSGDLDLARGFQVGAAPELIATPDGAAVSALCSGPDDRLLAVGSARGDLSLFAAAEGKELFTVHLPCAPCAACFARRRGAPLLAAGLADGSFACVGLRSAAVLWRAESPRGASTAFMRSLEAIPERLFVLPQPQVARETRGWRGADARVLAAVRITHPSCHVAAAAEGDLLAVATAAPLVRVFSAGGALRYEAELPWDRAFAERLAPLVAAAPAGGAVSAFLDNDAAHTVALGAGSPLAALPVAVRSLGGAAFCVFTRGFVAHVIERGEVVRTIEFEPEERLPVISGFCHVTGSAQAPLAFQVMLLSGTVYSFFAVGVTARLLGKFSSNDEEFCGGELHSIANFLALAGLDRVHVLAARGGIE
eukprot:gnl/Chilomastix_cuspidata/4755.p1 GENE.gnl/Chilomastix_cuspidata/4755~~gnl/Chilomastix_cuspidata/4755.p1  ORF type:complete len:623 (-),score=215.39 gnl/Chilomastix_cuspidata/4755:22-1890(-)